MRVRLVGGAVSAAFLSVPMLAIPVHAADTITVAGNSGLTQVNVALDPATVSANPYVQVRAGKYQFEFRDDPQLTEAENTIRSGVLASGPELSTTLNSLGLSGSVPVWVVGCASADEQTCDGAARLAQTEVAFSQAGTFDAVWEVPPTDTLIAPEQKVFVTAPGDLPAGTLLRYNAGPPTVASDAYQEPHYGYATAGQRVEVDLSEDWFRVERCSAQTREYCDKVAVTERKPALPETPPLGDMSPQRLRVLSNPSHALGETKVALNDWRNGADLDLSWSLVSESGEVVSGPTRLYSGPSDSLADSTSFTLNPSGSADRVLPDGEYVLRSVATWSNSEASRTDTVTRAVLDVRRAFSPERVVRRGETVDLARLWRQTLGWTTTGIVVHNSAGAETRRDDGYGAWACADGTDGCTSTYDFAAPPVTTLGGVQRVTRHVGDAWGREFDTSPFSVAREVPHDRTLVTRTRTVRVRAGADPGVAGDCSTVARPGPRRWPGAAYLISNHSCDGTAGHDDLARATGTTYVGDSHFDRILSYRWRFYGGAASSAPTTRAYGRSLDDGSAVDKSARLSPEVGWHYLPTVRPDPARGGSPQLDWAVDTLYGGRYEVKFAEVTVTYRAWE